MRDGLGKAEKKKNPYLGYLLTSKDVAACLGGITEAEADVIMLTLTDKKSVYLFSLSTHPTRYVKAGTVTAIIMEVRRKYPYGTLASAVRTRYTESLKIASLLNAL